MRHRIPGVGIGALAIVSTATSVRVVSCVFVQSAITVLTFLGEVSVRLWLRGEPGAGAVLLLHANPGDGRDFDAIVHELAGDWTVVTVDWPGYGLSTVTDPDSVTADGLVGVASRVLEALAARGFGRVSVIGNSVGGYVGCGMSPTRAGPTACSP